MPWPTDPASEFFGRGLWGWATSVWERITSNGSGALNVHIASQTGTQLIQQTTPTLLNPGIHGYDGAAWRKLSLLWGYSDRLAIRLDHTKAGAGDYNMDFTAVPAGEVWVLNTVISRNSATAVQHEYLISDAATWYPVFPYGTPGANVFRMSGYIQFVLKAGDWARIVFRACLNNDILTGEVWGYKMAVG